MFDLIRHISKFSLSHPQNSSVLVVPCSPAIQGRLEEVRLNRPIAVFVWKQRRVPIVPTAFRPENEQLSPSRTSVERSKLLYTAASHVERYRR